MKQEMLVRIRSIDGSPIRCDRLAAHIEAAGCYVVSVPQRGTGCRVRRAEYRDEAARGWLPRVVSPRRYSSPVA